MTRNRDRLLPRSVVALLIIGLLLVPVDAAAEDPVWVSQFGTAGPDSAEAVALAPSGLYATGFRDEDAFVRRYDTDGTLVWDVGFGTARREWPSAIAVDATGVYVTGMTRGSLVAGYHNPGEFSDIFVRKYDLDGQELWTRQFGSQHPVYNDYGEDHGRGIAVDGTGVYVAGDVWYSLPGQEDTDPRSSDAFLRKYTPDGEELWTRQYGGSGTDYAHAVSVNSSGVYVAGGKTYTMLDGSGETDATVTAFDTSGAQRWNRQFGQEGPDRQIAYGVAADALGVYVTGGTENGDEGPFLQKYDLNGAPLWYRSARSEGTPTHPFGDAYAIALDPDGVYIAGEAMYRVVAEGQQGVGGAFARKYTPDGTRIWTRQFGAGWQTGARAVGVDPAGVYFGGRTGSAFPGETNAGEDDAMVGKLAHPVGSDPVVAVERNFLLAENGQTVTNSGTYSDPDLGDDVTIRASVGQVTKTGTNAGSWEWSYTTADYQDQGVRIIAEDGHGGVWSAYFYVAVYQLQAPDQVEQGDAFPVSVASSTATSAGPDVQYAFNCGRGYGAPTASDTATCAAHTYPSQTVGARVLEDGEVAVEEAKTVSVADVTAPAVFAPAHRLAAGTALGTGTIPVRLSWSATDAASGVAGYQVQQRMYASGSWSAWGWVSQCTTAKALTRQLTPGTYQFRVRARDKAGNWSTYKSGTSFPLAAYQQTSTAAAGKVTFTGAWASQSLSSHFGGSTKYASAKGATASFTFTGGRQVAWVAPKGTNRGYAHVYLGGTKVATVNLYASSAQYRRVVFAKAGLNPGVTHTLKVYVPGTKPAGSTGTRVDIDGFVVLR